MALQCWDESLPPCRCPPNTPAPETPVEGGGEQVTQTGSLSLQSTALSGQSWSGR